MAKLNSENRNVQIGSAVSSHEFRLKGGPALMRILSDLYEDPVKAMVREYMTNMGDATRALQRQNPNTTPRPGEITTPTTMDARMVFKDFGIGLSPEDVMDVFMVYGESTKNNDSLDTGGFGLGCKTAFAYDGGANWTVETRQDGESHTFAFFINERGVPSGAHVGTETTDEPNGLTVTIPLRREHIAKATKYIKYFAPFMEFPLLVDDVEVTQERFFENDNWYFTKEERGPGITESHVNVIMGGVPYPVQDNDLMSVFKVTDRWGYKRNLHVFPRSPVTNSFGYTLNIKVPVDSVDVPPSRDTLMVTDRTRDKLAEVAKTYAKEAIDYVASQVDSSLSGLALYRSVVEETSGWFFGDTSVNDEILLKFFTKDEVENNIADGFYGEKYSINWENTFYRASDASKSTPNVDENISEVTTFVHGERGTTSLRVIIDDGFRAIKSLARAYFRQEIASQDYNGRASGIKPLAPWESYHEIGVLVIDEDEGVTKEDVLKALPVLTEDKVVFASEISDLYSSPSVSSSTAKAEDVEKAITIYQSDWFETMQRRGYFYNDKDSLTVFKKAIPEGDKYYLVVDNGASGTRYRVQKDEMPYLEMLVEHRKDFPGPLFCVRKDDEEYLDGSVWTDAKEWVADHLTTVDIDLTEADMTFLEMGKQFSIYEESNSLGHIALLMERGLDAHLNSDHPFHKVKEVLRVISSSSHDKSEIRLAQAKRSQEVFGEDKVTIPEANEEIVNAAVDCVKTYKRYPLLRGRAWHGKDMMEHIARYIKMVDGQHENG